ncbi:hypothetical protein Tco_1018192 [Tanacetum coccineum]|uniref:Uncharacterized protein n=1 Tax=Tanacetum coccineum TaxID=301880 RepID=A0ABQ5FW73_9ASTR
MNVQGPKRLQVQTLQDEDATNASPGRGGSNTMKKQSLFCRGTSYQLDDDVDDSTENDFGTQNVTIFLKLMNVMAFDSDVMRDPTSQRMTVLKDKRSKNNQKTNKKREKDKKKKDQNKSEETDQRSQPDQPDTVKERNKESQESNYKSKGH